MNQVITTENLRQWLDVVVQLVVIVVPILIGWFIYTYVKSSNLERATAAIVRLSNVAIDYVENLDKRGALHLPPDVKKATYKLKLGAEWLESELKRSGISITTDDAAKWISSIFQKRVGEVRPINDILEFTGTAVDEVLTLEQNGVLKCPPQIDRYACLAEPVADLVQAKLTEKVWTSVPREELVTIAKSELIKRLGAAATQATATVDPLLALASEAVAFVQQLKRDGQITVQPGSPGEDIESDIITAYMLTEVAKRGMVVSSSQITQAISATLHKV